MATESYRESATYSAPLSLQGTMQGHPYPTYIPPEHPVGYASTNYTFAAYPFSHPRSPSSASTPYYDAPSSAPYYEISTPYETPDPGPTSFFEQEEKSILLPRPPLTRQDMGEDVSISKGGLSIPASKARPECMKLMQSLRDGSQWYTSQNQLFRAIQTLHIDLSSVRFSFQASPLPQVPESTPARALHWQVSQATHLQNIEITMAEGREAEPGTGMVLGNEQFIIRNVSISNAIKGIEQLWDWSFNYIGLSINNCQTGVYAHTGSTLDIQTTQQTLDDYAGCRIIYFDAGIYRISDTLTIPPSSIIVGEAYPTIQAFGSNFADSPLPRVGVRVGADADHRNVEISGMLFNAAGGSKVRSLSNGTSTKTPKGMTDAGLRIWVYILRRRVPHILRMFGLGPRITISTHKDKTKSMCSLLAECLLSPKVPYGFMEQPHGLYRYLFDGAQNVFTYLIQTETPYYQPTPSTDFFPSSSSLLDPSTYPSNNGSAWAIYVRNSKDVTIAGAGLYSFFSSYNQTCIASFSC
ncbi:glycoside hydrolase family 55 protein [Atractiella rhizophila]|nr:glycoside hydrolase family 55 protein [Atractiella rhizophila]